MDNDIDYFKINECTMYKFYQIPKELFENKLYKENLNSDSKILYGFLLDRLSLSQMNNWYDENGNIYLIFTRESVQDLLNLSDKTVTKAFKQLTEVNLIKEKRQGLGKPNLIYVGKFKMQNINEYIKQSNVQDMSRNFYDSRNRNNTLQDMEILRGINTNNNYTNINNIDIISRLEKIKEKCLLSDFTNEEKIFLEDIIEKLYYTQNLKIGSVIIPNSRIVEKLEFINKNNLLQLLDLREKVGNINNVTNYMATCLYNSLGSNYLNNKLKSNKLLNKRNYKEDFIESFYDNL